MNADFHKFPSTPHLVWLGREPVREDKVLTPKEASRFLGGEVIVEEKIDGANLGISVDGTGQLRFQNRGNFLKGPMTGQWRPLRGWASRHLSAFFDHLEPGLILFGEWCHATHSIAYSRLPDWFLVFDVFDSVSGRFWSTARRNRLAKVIGLAVVPQLFEGRVTFADLKKLVAMPSPFAETAREGLYLRRENGGHLEKRAKLVNPEFTQQIAEHWSRGAMRMNQLAPDAPIPAAISEWSKRASDHRV
jgi:ATP-dependent RNA circularization protein (DNA/RNA ligase family)